MKKKIFIVVFILFLIVLLFFAIYNLYFNIDFLNMRLYRDYLDVYRIVDNENNIYEKKDGVINEAYQGKGDSNSRSSI